jgi:hypothetical protein
MSESNTPPTGPVFEVYFWTLLMRQIVQCRGWDDYFIVKPQELEDDCDTLIDIISLLSSGGTENIHGTSQSRWRDEWLTFKPAPSVYIYRALSLHHPTCFKPTWQGEVETTSKPYVENLNLIHTTILIDNSKYYLTFARYTAYPQFFVSRLNCIK